MKNVAINGVGEQRALCERVMYVLKERGGLIEKACADKCRSLESCSLRVKKVSADVETWNFVYCGCVGKPRERKQNIFRSVWDN